MPRKGKRRRIATNIYADASGLEAIARATVDGVAVTRSKRYDRDTPIKDIRVWQNDTERELRKLTGVSAKTTFAADVETYLPLVRQELASFTDRERHLRAWIPVFGAVRRHQIRTPAIDKQLRTWRNITGLSASTVNQRRDALSDFFQKLNGSDGSNPVKGAVWFARPKSRPKGIDRGRIARVLAHMDPDRKTRWRLSLMHWTGMRPSQQGRLTGPDDFYLDDRAFIVDINGQPRRVPAVMVPSGKGGAPVMFPLGQEGEEVARHFLRVDAFWRPPTPDALRAQIAALERKPQTSSRTKAIARLQTALARKPRQTWSCPAAYKRIVAAAKAVGEAPFTVYTIKHSFASGLRHGDRPRRHQDMLGHADIASTRIYAPAVQAKHVQAIDRLRADDARRYDDSHAAEPLADEKCVAPKRGSESDAA
jgi:integrase